MDRCVNRQTAARERGAVAVEFALVFPILVMVVFGIISFGIVFSQQVTLGNSVRDGARFGSVGLYSDAAAAADQNCDDVINATRNNANTLAMGGDDVEVEVRRGPSYGASTQICYADAGDPAPASSARPCALPSPSGTVQNLYVKATFESEISIPLVAYEPSVDLTSTGAYRCEYD